MDLEEAHNLIKKWLFPITDDDKLTIKRIFTGTENSIGIHFKIYSINQTLLQSIRYFRKYYS